MNDLNQLRVDEHRAYVDFITLPARCPMDVYFAAFTRWNKLCEELVIAEMEKGLL